LAKELSLAGSLNKKEFDMSVAHEIDVDKDAIAGLCQKVIYAA
jgi:hypothetical protein